MQCKTAEGNIELLEDEAEVDSVRHDYRLWSFIYYYFNTDISLHTNNLA